MAKLSQLMTDPTKNEQGIWVDYDDGMRLRVCSTSKRAYEEARESLLRPHRRRIRDDRMSPSEIAEVIKPAVARHLLVDWEGLEDEDGNEIPYTPEKALELFNNPLLEDLYVTVMEVAGKAGAFRRDSLEESAKNSPTSCDGNSSGDGTGSSLNTE